MDFRTNMSFVLYFLFFSHDRSSFLSVNDSPIKFSGAHWVGLLNLEYNSGVSWVSLWQIGRGADQFTKIYVVFNFRWLIITYFGRLIVDHILRFLIGDFCCLIVGKFTRLVIWDFGGFIACNFEGFVIRNPGRLVMWDFCHVVPRQQSFVLEAQLYIENVAYAKYSLAVARAKAPRTKEPIMNAHLPHDLMITQTNRRI